MPRIILRAIQIFLILKKKYLDDNIVFKKTKKPDTRVIDLTESNKIE